MGEAANDPHEPVDSESAKTHNHEQRNRTQAELLRLAAQTRKHRDYIDSMLERAAPEPGTWGEDDRKDQSDPDI
jgi:hypothetical protein